MRDWLKRNDNWIYVVSVAMMIAGLALAVASLKSTQRSTMAGECWQGMEIGSDRRC